MPFQLLDSSTAKDDLLFAHEAASSRRRGYLCWESDRGSGAEDEDVPMLANGCNMSFDSILHGFFESWHSAQMLCHIPLHGGRPTPAESEPVFIP